MSTIFHFQLVAAFLWLVGCGVFGFIRLPRWDNAQAHRFLLVFSIGLAAQIVAGMASMLRMIAEKSV